MSGIQIRTKMLTNPFCSFSAPVAKTEFCQVLLDETKLKAFMYAVKNHYWYQMYVDDLPIWGKYREIYLEGHGKYSHDQRTGLVWFSNGPNISVCSMFGFSNGVQKLDKKSGFRTLFSPVLNGHSKLVRILDAIQNLNTKLSGVQVNPGLLL